MDSPLIWRRWKDATDDKLLKEWTPVTEGLHIDQNPVLKKGMQSVQGMMPLYPVNTKIGGLEVVPHTNTDEV